MFPVPRTFFAALADGHVVDEGEAEGDTRQGVDAVFDGLEQVVVVDALGMGVGGAAGECELATAPFGHLFRLSPAFFGRRSDGCHGFTGEEGEWEWVGGTFLQWIVALLLSVCPLAMVRLWWRRQREACFSEEGECEDGQAGGGEEDVQRGIVDPLDPCAGVSRIQSELDLPMGCAPSPVAQEKILLVDRCCMSSDERYSAFAFTPTPLSLATASSHACSPSSPRPSSCLARRRTAGSRRRAWPSRWRMAGDSSTRYTLAEDMRDMRDCTWGGTAAG